MEKITCSNCKSEISKNQFLKHQKTCNHLYENKNAIIEFYSTNKSIKLTAEHFNLYSVTLSKILKKWNVEVDPNVGRFKTEYFVNENFFDKMDSEQYWMIGFLLADGSIQNKKYISFTQSGEEGKELIQYAKDALNCTSPINSRPTTHQDSHSLYFSSEKTGKLLTEYGLVSNRDKILKFPTTIPSEHIQDFIRGYFEGDGSVGIYKDKRSGTDYFVWSMICPPDFAETIKEKMWSILKIEVSLNQIKDSHMIEIRKYGKEALQICEWIYQNETLYKSYKFKIFEDFKTSHIFREDKYSKIREQCESLFKERKSAKEVAETLEIHLDTLYRWIREGKVKK